jgi:hypothetical protein
MIKCFLTAGRVLRRADPAQVAALAARQAQGHGASIGVIRRSIIAAVLVCGAGATGGLIARQMLPPAGTLDPLRTRVAPSVPVAASGQPTSVPEPATLALFGGAVLGLVVMRRRGR